MFTSTLNRAQAEELFNREAVLYNKDAVPEYRVLELFGGVAADFISRTLSFDGYLRGGTDWNGWGDCSPERPFMHIYYLSGFLKIVAEHNYTINVAEHKTSRGGELSDAIKQRREEELARADKEDRKKARAKRAKE